MSDLPIQEKADGVIIKIFVQPKASKNAVAGLHGDALKVRLTAPPVDGAANKMCLKFLGKTFGLPPSALEIVSGHTSRTKQIFLPCNDGRISFEQIRTVIERLIG